MRQLMKSKEKQIRKHTIITNKNDLETLRKKKQKIFNIASNKHGINIIENIIK